MSTIIAHSTPASTGTLPSILYRIRDSIERWRRPRALRDQPSPKPKPSIAELMACAAQNARHIACSDAPQWAELSRARKKIEIEAQASALRTLGYVWPLDYFPDTEPLTASAWCMLTRLIAQDASHE